MDSWYNPLRPVVSRGSQIDPVGGLAGLAAAREQHLGQFFTPESVVRFMWAVVGLIDARIVNPYDDDETIELDRPVWYVLDNSFGSGRMFSPADPRRHVLHGVEVDEPLAQQVIVAARTAGFVCDLHVGSMVDFTTADKRSGGYSRERFHVGVINPPFSLHFDSPNVAKFPDVGTFGKFGAASSCFSQNLAVAQALAWCDRVVAVVPRSFTTAALELARRARGTRLALVFHLPRSVFRDEGAEVDVSVLVWREQERNDQPRELTIDKWPIDATSYLGNGFALAPIEQSKYEGRSPSLVPIGTPLDQPATTLPITGDRSIRLAHDGRHLVVKADDAAAYVEAMNELLVERVSTTEHRRVKRVVYSGQGRLDIETLLAQPDPRAALQSIVDQLTTIGLVVSLDPSFARHFERRARRHPIDVAPFGHTAFVEDGGFADWLSRQTSLRLRPKPNALTDGAWQYRERAATTPCYTCASWDDAHIVVSPADVESDEAEGEDEAEGPDAPQWCWRCKCTRVLGNSARTERLRILDTELVAQRGRPLGYGKHKEPRSTRRWVMTLTGDGGADDKGQPIQRLVEESWLESELALTFDFPDFTPYVEGWTPVHPSLASRFPEAFKRETALARRAGIDKWLWSYQLHDLCEIRLKRGAIIAWEMGLGKARLAAALCLLGGKHNLITVETRLIREMETEFRLIGLPADAWQTITKPEQCRPGRLRRINLISYDKLKSTLPGRKRPKPVVEIDPRTGKPKKEKPRTFDVRHTFAGLLRRRVHTHVCDEGHLLAHPTTQQTRAVVHVSAKGRRYLLTGTPISNYPRDVLRLLQWAAGDGTARQRFGDRWPLMREENVSAFGEAPRGVDEFRELFVTLQWVTHEFEDEMEEGAKREVPVIADIPGFRRVVQHVVKRRVAAEPDVTKHVRIPVPTIIDTLVDWDADHLALYRNTSREFVEWYKREYAELTGDKKGAHLIAVLRKLYAVYCAANFPQGGVDGQPAWAGAETSKQRLAVARLLEWTLDGRKSIVLTEGPRTVTHLAVQLRERGIDVVEFHGGIPISKRIDALDKRFRNGKAQVLAATKPVLKTGYNLAEASRVLAYDRNWTPMVEHQAFARVLRPQQQHDVVIERLVLRGSIDEYQHQMIDQKSLAMRSGLDYGAGAPPGTEFRHLDSIFAQFVSDFEASENPVASDNAA
jgi:hypothetical protein